MIPSLALIVALASPSPASAPSCTPVTTPFVGSICTPTTPGKHPAILLLGGSEGGDATANRMAPQFARRGFVAVAVAYFGLPGLPSSLEDVPVESVGKALAETAKRSDVDANHIAIFGASKGGELALLVASTYPQIHAVVADVPSPFAWQGIAQAPGAPTSSWTLDGKPLPYVSYGTAMQHVFMATYVDHKPLDLRPGYVGAMKERADQIPTAMFHLENIHGPVLLLAADDDQIWDSVAQSKIAMDYLGAHHHPYADKLLTYPNAGHMFLFASPARPFTSAPFGGGVTIEFGGTPVGNVAAAQAAWAQISAFLATAFAPISTAKGSMATPIADPLD